LDFLRVLLNLFSVLQYDNAEHSHLSLSHMAKKTEKVENRAA